MLRMLLWPFGCVKLAVLHGSGLLVGGFRACGVALVFYRVIGVKDHRGQQHSSGRQWAG